MRLVSLPSPGALADQAIHPVEHGLNEERTGRISPVNLLKRRRLQVESIDKRSEAVERRTPAITDRRLIRTALARGSEIAGDPQLSDAAAVTRVANLLSGLGWMLADTEQVAQAEAA